MGAFRAHFTFEIHRRTRAAAEIGVDGGGGGGDGGGDARGGGGSWGDGVGGGCVGRGAARGPSFRRTALSCF